MGDVMNAYHIKIQARPYGAQGILFEWRDYYIKAENENDARQEAIRLGHAERLEHITIHKCEKD